MTPCFVISNKVPKEIVFNQVFTPGKGIKSSRRDSGIFSGIASQTLHYDSIQYMANGYRLSHISSQAI